MTARILLTLYLSTTGGAQDRVPGDSYEWPGDCPAACCGYSIEWTAAADVPAWSDPLPPDVPAHESPPAFVVRAGETVRAVTGTLQVRRRGRAVMREDFSTDASYPSLSARHRQTITLLAGEDVHLLAPRGDETWRIWHRGRVLDAHLYRVGREEACRAQGAACAGVILREPLTRWWVMVINRQQQVGWVDGSAAFERAAACR